MMRRFFKLTNFRNIGLNGNSENKIIINNSLEKGKMGGVIELIGANNSGKSNVLDSIIEYGSKRLIERDITTLSFDAADRIPQVSLIYQDDNGTIEHVLSFNNNKIEEFFNIKNDIEEDISVDETINALRLIEDGYKNNGWGTSDISNLINRLSDVKMISEDSFSQIQIIIKNIERYASTDLHYRNISNKIPEDLKKYFNNEKSSQGDDYIYKKYKYHFEPRIIKYVEKNINPKDMISNVNNLDSNLFFRSVFKAIDIDISEILSAYQQYNKFSNVASLEKIQKKINKKIGDLNDQFNKLYFAESDEYKFSIKLESEKVSFGMARGKDDEPIMIEMQSTGFRWFFNLYFNFICSGELHSGDIIIMDEPATNLHPEGQKELRRFIKSFAMKNDLTFIIATHSPFLIDVDNYDELRLVSMENNRSTIDNLFSAVNVDDPDSLLPIKEALTIKQNVLYDLDTEVIWVEGITDYNYLTLFKKLLNVKNVNFIPYNGNGKNDEEAKRILSKLTNIKFYRRGILVDSDKSGKAMAKLCENTVFKDRIYSISNVNPSYLEIEDLFSDDDKKKFESLNKKSDLFKKAGYSSVMKNTTELSDFSEETINNFKKLFEIITD